MDGGNSSAGGQRLYGSVVPMSCQICKRGNCTESFHSIAEQERFEQRVEAILVSPPDVVPAPAKRGLVPAIQWLRNLKGSYLASELAAEIEDMFL